MTPLVLWCALAAICFALVAWTTPMLVALGLALLLIFSNAAPPQQP